MKKQLTYFFTAITVLVLGAFFLFVFNQIMQVYQYASTLNPIFGQVVLWTLSALFILLLIIPVVLYYRLPQSLPMPETEEERAAHMVRLGKRLSRNQLLLEEKLTFQVEDDFTRAFALLDEKANEVIVRTAKGVFLTTAVSQNGKLDALTVLITQTKMVWDLAHIYYQRPAPRDFLRMYSNVAAATFFAAQLEDMDVSEHVEPVVGTLLQSSALKSVPFLGTATNIIMDSLLEGTVNAYLTLRVGVVTKRYCGAPDHFVPSRARRAAYAEAAGMLRRLVMESSGQVIASMAKATRRAGANTVKSGMRAVGKATGTVKSGFTNLFRSTSTDTESAE